jgi:hypothetical protein
MTRVVSGSGPPANAEAASLVTAVFAAELVRPSRGLWIVSQAMADAPLVDNRAGEFEALTPWGLRPIRLSELLTSLARRGSTIVVGTTPAPANQAFLARVARLFADHAVSDWLVVGTSDGTGPGCPAIAGDDFCITGRLDFSSRGVVVRDGPIRLDTEPESVAAARTDLQARFGGQL